MSDVVVISSEEETEPEPKRRKISVKVTKNIETIDCEARLKLGKLPEITIYPESPSKNETFISNQHDEKVIILDDTEQPVEILNPETKDCSAVTKENAVVSENDVSSTFQDDDTILIDDNDDSLSQKTEECVDGELDQSTLEINDVLICKKSEPVIVTSSETVVTSSSNCPALLLEFLSTVKASIENTKYEQKLLDHLPKLQKLAEQCPELQQDTAFNNMMQDYIKMSKESSEKAVCCYEQVYNYIRDVSSSSCSYDLAPKDVKKVKTLRKLMEKVVARIRVLESREVDFDDEENSSYLILDRYVRRLDEIHKKYCKILKINPHQGRKTYEKVFFVSSSYNEINQAISKITRPNYFPTYYDIEKCIQECVANSSNLSLSNAEIQFESKQCFERLGNMLQQNRRKDLYEGHRSFLVNLEDPAKSNPELDEKLRKNGQECEEKLKSIITKYTKMQEANVNIVISDDSDDSHCEENETE